MVFELISELIWGNCLRIFINNKCYNNFNKRILF